MSGVQVFVEDEINPFIGTGVNPAAVDDFQGDNFDHCGLGFFGGGYLYPSISGGRPIQVRAVAARHAALGLGMEEGDDRLVQPHLPDQRARHELCLAHELSRSRPDL